MEHGAVSSPQSSVSSLQSADLQTSDLQTSDLQTSDLQTEHSDRLQTGAPLAGRHSALNIQLLSDQVSVAVR